MKAGRELDALVAEHIFKLRFWKEQRGQYSLCVGETFDGRESWKSSRIHRHELYERVSAMEAARIGFFGQGIKPYSSSIADAWQVVEKMRELSFNFGVQHPCVGHEGKAFVFFHGYTGDVIGKQSFAVADTAPLAICEAALAAVGVEVPE